MLAAGQGYQKGSVRGLVDRLMSTILLLVLLVLLVGLVIQRGFELFGPLLQQGIGLVESVAEDTDDVLLDLDQESSVTGIEKPALDQQDRTVLGGDDVRAARLPGQHAHFAGETARSQAGIRAAARTNNRQLAPEQNQHVQAGIALGVDRDLARYGPHATDLEQELDVAGIESLEDLDLLDRLDESELLLVHRLVHKTGSECVWEKPDADLPPWNVPISRVRIWDTQADSMSRKRYPAEQIIGHLRQAEIRTSEGKTVAEAVRELGISEQTYYRWRKQYGGMEVNQARRLKELEQENGRLKRLVADQALDLSIHKEVSRGNF